MTSSSSNGRTCWFLRKSDQETEQQHTLRMELKKKAKMVDLGCQEARARKAEKVLSNTTRRRKENAKKIDQETGWKETISPERQYARKTGKSPPPCFKYNRGNCSDDRECDCWHLHIRNTWMKHMHCKHFKNDECETVQKEKVKERSPKKVTVAVVNIAYHCPRTTSGKLLQFHEHPLVKAEGNLERMRRSKVPLKGILAFKRELLSEKKSIRFSHQSLKRAKFRDEFPSLNVIHQCSKNGSSPNAPRMTEGLQSGMRSKKSLQGKKHTNFTKRSSRWKESSVMSTKQTSSEVTSLQRRRIPRPAWRYIPKKGCT